MSFLVMPTGPAESTQAVLSIWFKIPQESYDAAIPPGGQNPETFMIGGVPIISFGPQVSSDFQGDNVGSSWIGAVWNPAFNMDGSQVQGQVFNPGDNTPQSESNGFGLAFNLQWDTKGSGTDDTETYFPDNIMMGITSIGGNGFWAPSIIPVQADQWHHLLMSWDIKSCSGTAWEDGSFPTNDWSTGISGGSTIDIVLDDQQVIGDPAVNNYNFWPCGGYFGGTKWITMKVYYAASAPVSRESSASSPLGPVLMSNDPFGLPSAGIIAHNWHCELGEFQMFLGMTADVHSEAVRRAFIDKDGKPVPSNKKSSQDDPTSGSEEYFGQKPDVLLHGVSNWKKGHNTGTTGVDSDGNDISAGQFTPTGGIAKYKPNPQLGK